MTDKPRVSAANRAMYERIEKLPVDTHRPATKRKRLKPIEARTFEQVCTLPRDGYDTKHFWILIDGDIVICEQEFGKAPTATMKIKRAEFDRMARWYVTGRATK